MYKVLRSTAHRFPIKTPSFFSSLLDDCLSRKSLYNVKLVHAQLIKIGLSCSNTFLGNRCVDLYSKLGTFQDAFRAFDEIEDKNVFSWNICIRILVKCGDIEGARRLFDEMPERDVVSWNSMISGYASSGFVDCTLGLFSKMRSSGVMPSGYTFSIVLSSVRCASHGKEIHGSTIRSGMGYSCVVVGNSLIDMYGKHALVDYAFGVFSTMEELDVISWNSLIAGCCKSGYEEMAYKQFCLMRSNEYLPDAFTISSLLTVCSSVRDLEKGKTIFSLSIKLGFLSNTVVSSAAIDMFSKCNSIDDSICIFKEIDTWDSAVCNSMISSYARHGFEENAMQMFILALKKNVRPTEFTLSNLVSCASVFLPVAHGTQLHSLVVKLGFERDSVISSSLVEMYSKYGLIGAAMNIFAEMGVRDLISWNTMILGLTCNGKAVEALKLFKELLERGPAPDEITFSAVLLACNYGRLVDEGMSIFSSMEKDYGITPKDGHYTCIVDMLVQVGELSKVPAVIKAMPYELNASICTSILSACVVQGDLKFTERIAEKLMELDPMSSLPYTVLAKAYEMRGRWESVVRVKKVLKDRNLSKVIGCSWIGITNNMFLFKSNEVLHHGGEDIYSVVRLLTQEIEDEDDVLRQSSTVGDER